MKRQRKASNNAINRAKNREAMKRMTPDAKDQHKAQMAQDSLKRAFDIIDFQFHQMEGMMWMLDHRLTHVLKTMDAEVLADIDADVKMEAKEAGRDERNGQRPMSPHLQALVADSPQPIKKSNIVLASEQDAENAAANLQQFNKAFKAE